MRVIYFSMYLNNIIKKQVGDYIFFIFFFKQINYLVFKDFCFIGSKLFFVKKEESQKCNCFYVKYIQLNYINYICFNIIGFLIYYYCYLLICLKRNLYIYKKKFLFNVNIFFFIKSDFNKLVNLLKKLKIFIRNFLYLKNKVLIFKNLMLLFFNFIKNKLLLNNYIDLRKVKSKFYLYNVYIYNKLYNNKIKFFSFNYYYKNINMILVFYFFFKKFLIKNKNNIYNFNKLIFFNYNEFKFMKLIFFNFYKIVIFYKIKKFMKNYFNNLFQIIYIFYNKNIKILKHKNFKIFMFLFKNLLIFFEKKLYNFLVKNIKINLIFIFNKIKIVCFDKFFFIERFMFNNFVIKIINRENKISMIQNKNNFLNINFLTNLHLVNKYKNNKIWYYLFNNIYISKNLIYLINIFSNKNYLYLSNFFNKIDSNENKLLKIKNYGNFTNLNFFNLIEFFEKIKKQKIIDLYFIKNENFLLFNFFYKFLNIEENQINYNSIYDFYKMFIIKELFLLIYLKFFPKKHAYEFYDKVFDILDDYDYNEEIIQKSKYKYNEYNSKVLETYNYLPKIDGFKDYYDALLNTFDFSLFIKKKFDFNFFVNKNYKNMLHFFTRPSSEFGLFPVINLYKIKNLSKHLKHFDLEDCYKNREFFQDWIYMKKSIEKLNLFSIFDIFSNKNSNILNLKDFLDFEILNFFFLNNKKYNNLVNFLYYYILYHKLFLKKNKYQKINYQSFLVYLNRKWKFLYNIYNNEKDNDLIKKYKLKAQVLFKESLFKNFVLKYNILLNKFYLIKNKFNFFKYSFFYKLVNIPFIFNYSFEFFENQKNYVYRKFFQNNYLFFNLNSSDFFINLKKDFLKKKFKYSEVDFNIILKNKNELIYFFDLYYMNLLINQSYLENKDFFINKKINKLNLFLIYKLYIFINKFKNFNNLNNLHLLKIYKNNLKYVFNNFFVKKNFNSVILNMQYKKIIKKKNLFYFFFLINFFKIYLNYYYKFLILNNYLLKEYQLILPNKYKYGFLNQKANFLTFDLNMRFKFIFLGDYLNYKEVDAFDLHRYNNDLENNLDEEEFIKDNYFEKKQYRSLENLNFLVRYNWPTFDDFINIPYDWSNLFFQIKKTNTIYYKINFFFFEVIQFIFKRKIKFFNIKYIGTLYYDGFIWFEYFFLLKYNWFEFINYFTLKALFFPIYNIFFEIFYTFQSYYYDFDYYHIYDNIEMFEEIHTNYYDFLLGNFYFDYSPFSLINNLDESDALMDETGEFNYFLTSNEFLKRQNDDFIKDLLYGHDLFFDYEIFESLGFNGILLDEDFQYIVNVNDLFIFFSSGILKFQELFIVLFKYSLLYYTIVKSICLNFKYSKIYLFFKFFFKLVSIPFLIIIFLYLYIIYISCVLVNILILSLQYLKFNYNIFFNINIFSNLIYMSNFIIILNFFYLKKIVSIVFFFLFQYFQGKKNLFYINDSILKYLKFFFKKLYNILIFFIYRLLLIYLFFIFFFLNYDNIYLFLEKIFFISIDVRSFSLIYLYLFFFLIILIFNPFTKIGNLIWSIRYEILGLSFWFWWLSGYINSIDIFLFYFWSNIHLLLDLNFNNADLFLSFYESVISPWNQGLPELQVKFFDFWYDWIVENKNEFIDFLNIFDFFNLNPLIYKYTRYCYKFLVKEYFIIYNFFNIQLNNFFYDLNNKYMFYFYDHSFNFKLYFFPFFISFRVLNELCTGDAYYFINLFKDFFFFRYQGLAEGNLLYYKLYYKLNNFEYIEFLKNNLNYLYVDMWGGYKPKNSHLINFYYRNEYVYTEGNTEWFLESAEADRAVVGYVDPVRFNDLQYRPNKWWAKKPEFVNDFLRYTKFHHVRYKQYKYVAYTPWRFYNQDYSVYFNKILLPDLAFIGGSQWFYDPDLFQYTHTIRDDGIIFTGGRFISSEYEY